MFTHPYVPKKFMETDHVDEWFDPFALDPKPIDILPETPVLDIVHEYFWKLGECQTEILFALRDEDPYDINVCIIPNVKNWGWRDFSAEVLEAIHIRYTHNPSEFWDSFQFSYEQLVITITRTVQPTASIQEFIDRVAKPQCTDDIRLLRQMETFHGWGQKIILDHEGIYTMLVNVYAMEYAAGDNDFFSNISALHSLVGDYQSYFRERNLEFGRIFSDIYGANIGLAQSNAELKERVEMIETNTDWGGTAKDFAKHFNRNEDTMRHHMRAAHKERILRCAVEVANDEVEGFLQFMARPGKLRKQKKG